MSRAVIYARVSTNDQAHNNSLISQIAACQRYAAHHGMTVLATTQDVMSGAKLERPGLEKVRTLIEQGKVDALIVYTSDRLSRSVSHSLLLLNELKRAHVVLHCVVRMQALQDMSEVGLMETIETAFAEYERLKIGERSMRGKRAKAESGKHHGIGKWPLYGYRWHGEGHDRELLIDPCEAQVVRSIYSWYLELKSIGAVARRLTTRHIPTPTDNPEIRRVGKLKLRGYGEWSVTSVRAILRNEHYAGVFNAFKNSVPIQVSVPAIVDRTIWEAVQHQIDVGRKFRSTNSKHEYLLRSRIHCSCGYAMVGRCERSRWRVYVCHGTKGGKTVRTCRLPRFRADPVEDDVWNWLVTDILNEQHLLEAIEERQRAVETDRGKLDRQRVMLYEERISVQAQLNRFYDRYGRGKLTDEQLDELEAPRKATIKRIDVGIAMLDQQLASIGLSKDDVEEILNTAAEVRATLDEDLSFAAKRRVLDLLDVGVILLWNDAKPYADVTVAFTGDSKRVTISKYSSTGPGPWSAPLRSSDGWGRAKGARPGGCGRRQRHR